MNCPACNVENDAAATFCQQCGNRIMDDDAQAEAAIADADIPIPTSATDTKAKFEASVRSRQNDDDHEENDLWDGAYSPKAMVGWWVAAGLATLAGVVAGFLYLNDHIQWMLLAIVIGWLLLAGRYAYRRYGIHYYLTSQRFIHETGILWRTTDRIELIDIDDVTFKQGPVERMFNVGTIHLTSSDRSHPEMDLPGIDGVRIVADQIDDLRRKERRRRGLHIEAV